MMLINDQRVGMGANPCGHAGRTRPLSAIVAFTLLEVLVVVAVIALLMAILLPSLRKAREQSRRITCGSNTKQLGLAWQTYLIASNGWFPRRAVNANVNYGGRQGTGAATFGSNPATPVSKPLNKYIGLRAVTQEAKPFICPADAGISTFRPSCHEYVGTSYNTNNMVIGPGQLLALPTDPCNQPPRSLLGEINERLAKLPADAAGSQALHRDKVTTDSSRLVLLGDYGWWNAYFFTTDQDKAEWHERRSSYNLGFLDGHARFLKVRKGLQVTPEYAIVPFKDLLPLAAKSQQEVTP